MYLKNVFDGYGNAYTSRTGDLDRLTTDARENLVAAVNEVDERVPKVAAAQEGSFLRVENGRLTAAALTDVSEVGA